ncbi:MAG: glycerophosphodiester phosphodiesterase [Turicibacter sp.]
MIKNTIDQFNLNKSTFILFEIIYKLITFIIFIPISLYLVNMTQANLTVYSISRSVLYDLEFSIQKLIIVFFLFLISLVIISIELSILMYISNLSHQKKIVGLFDSVVNGIKPVHPITPSYLATKLLFAALIVPMIAKGIAPAVIRNLSELLFRGSSIVIQAASIVMFLLLIAIIFIFLNQPLKRKYIKMIIAILLWIIGNFLFNISVVEGFKLIGKLTVQILGASNPFSHLFIIFFLILFILGYLMISVLSLPLFISFITELDYKYRTPTIQVHWSDSLNVATQNNFYYIIQRHKKFIATSVMMIFFLSISFLSLTAIQDISPHTNKKMAITAHRGSCLLAPENSISSITKAMNEGADFAEIDVKLTKDKEVILFHDPSLKRMTGGDGEIKEMTLKELKMVKISGEMIPTLEEVLQVAKGKIKLNIELKTVDGDHSLGSKVAQLIDKYDMTQEVVVSSFNYDTIIEFTKLSPDVLVGYIFSKDNVDLSRLDIDFISVKYDLLTKELVDQMHALNREVHVWDVFTEEQALTAIHLGVDNIITDYVTTVANAYDFSLSADTNYLVWYYNCLSQMMRHVIV